MQNNSISSMFYKQQLHLITSVQSLVCVYQSIAGIRDELNRLEQRFATFNHQQFSFINALDHCRQIAFEPSREITSISQVNKLFAYQSFFAPRVPFTLLTNIFLKFRAEKSPC